MAIQYKLKNTNTINEAGNRIYLEDVTGEYSVDNIGGYGGPNLTRNAFALLVISALKHGKGDKLTELEPYNPLTVDKFTVIATQDGWHVFQLAVLPIYNELELEEYTTGDIFYDSLLGNIVRIDSTGNISGAIKVATIIEVKDLLNTDYIKASTDTLFIANNSKTKLRVNAQVSNAIFDGADFNDKKLIRYKDNYNAIRSILQGAIYEFCRGNKYVAQKNIEFLNNNNYVLD